MKKEALVLLLALCACSQDAKQPVHAAEGDAAATSEAVTPPSEPAAGGSLLEQAKGLASQVDLGQARAAIEQQLDQVGAQIQSLREEASAAGGAAKEGGTELVTRLQTRFEAAKQRYEAWKASGSNDLKQLASELQPLLAELKADLEAALAKVRGG